MKFTKATILSTLATAAANVNAQGHGPTKAGKNKNGAGSDDYEFPTSANFEGKYELCFQTVILTTRNGTNTTFNLCRDSEFTPPTRSRNLSPTGEAPQPGGGFFTEPLHNITITPTNDFNAYQAKIDWDIFVKYRTWNFQGFANGNNLDMQSFGVDNGDTVQHTPDGMTCALHNSGVLSCTQMFQEYCAPQAQEEQDQLANRFLIIQDPNESCIGGEGEWLSTHSIYSVSAKDINDCPDPPADFCPDNGGTCGGSLIRLAKLSERNTESPEEKDGHRRLVTDHDAGVVTHVQSKDSDRLEWIKNHIADRMDHMEAGGTSGWDPLIEEYFKNVHSNDIEIDCNFAEGSFKCNSSSKTQCGQDLIKGHADLHGEFAAAIQKKEGNPEFVPRDVPDSCV